MATHDDRKPVLKTLAFGALTIAMYAAVFTHAEVITTMFARGSLWAAGPIATVFVFSYVHGSFASNLWCVLGINACKRTTSKNAHARKSVNVNATRPAARAVVKA